jgi:DNA polymerase (family 10)
MVGEDAAELADHALEVLALVVRRQAHDQHRHIIASMVRSLPRNAELAERFELLADLLELDGADAFRLAAYRRAAVRIRESAVSVAELALEGKAQRLSGIGGTIEQKIVELAETGDLQAIAKLRARIPLGLVDITHVPGLGPKTARKLWQELGIENAEQLRAAAEQGLLRGVPGLGEKTEQNVLAHFAKPPERASRDGRALLGTVLPFVEAVVSELRSHPAAVRVSAAGSVRRRIETVRDLDVIATATDPAALIDHFATLPWVAEVVAKGPTKATVVGHDGLRFDLRVVPPECYGNLLQHLTGSKDHNVALREDAVRRGLSVSEYGVEEVATGTVTTMATEEELYAHLGYAWIPPELRENAGELEAARTGALPELVERGDVLGDLHTHTDWSDGRATLEQMVAAAAQLGYRYLAICDHAKRLKDGRLERQAERIAELNAGLAGIEILSGVEVDIRANGSLDLDDEALAARDWVVASIHSGFRDPPGEIERRLLAAIEHPMVDCIGHPTGRKIGRRAAYEVDLEKIFARAAETGTALEINGQPDRLDLRDSHARLAAQSGVRIVVSSDAHSVAGLGYLDLAVSQARRAWLTAPQVVNTRSWAAILKERKR